jgi:hypothetical protein
MAPAIKIVKRRGESYSLAGGKAARGIARFKAASRILKLREMGD